MKKYSSYWRITILIAIILHVIVFAALNLVFPYVEETKNNEVVEKQWVDVDLIKDEPQQSEVTIPETSKNEFSTILLPDIPKESLYVEPVKTPPEPVTPIIIEKPPKVQQPVMPKLSKDELDVINQFEKDIYDNVNKSDTENKQLMSQPPVVLTEFYPPKGGGLNFKGKVYVAVNIGKDGKVKSTKIMVSSGRIVIDNIALNAAAKWTFKPALNQEGKPMECDKIITFDFKNFS